MSIFPTPVGVVKSALTLKWRDTLIGAMALLLVACMSWIGSDLMSSRDKLKSIPDPAQIVTNKSVEQRFQEEDRKIDNNAAVVQDGMKRIESKVDTLLLSMATRRRASAPEPDSPACVGVPMTRLKPADNTVLASKK